MQQQQDNKGFNTSSILRSIFTTRSTELLVLRVFAAIIIALTALVLYSKNELFEMYKQSKYDSYAYAIQAERERSFENAAQEQLQIVHVSTESDFSAVFSFRPRNLNYFVDLVAYEGKLPAKVNEKNLGGFPINKTSDEYRRHLLGKSFVSTSEFQYIPTKDKRLRDEFQYMYSCPIFNLDNVYSGTITLAWKKKPDASVDNLDTLCFQSARTLGRIR